MSQSSAEPTGNESTSDRLYTPEELDEFARRQVEAARHGADVDPLSDPIGADPLAEVDGEVERGAPAEHTAIRPLAPDPVQPDPVELAAPAADRPAGAMPPPAATPLWPPQAAPAPPQAPPAGLGPMPVGPPPAAPPTQPAQHALPAQQPQAPQSALAVVEPRRFMTATDFLDRRDTDKELGPATWGWRGGVRRMTGGLIKPKMGGKEQSFHADRSAIQKDFSGPRTIAFINPKGGAAKTTGVLAAGFTFGTVRGGGVVAWDNNETRGTLGIRGLRSNHRNTTRELLEDLGRFKDVYQSRIGDLGAFVRSQGDAHFDVLASDERPDVTGIIHAEDFAEVHALLERFYRIILVDTGNNMRAENWLAAADAADLLVVTSTVREDTGYSGLWMLDALQDAGHANLKHKTITVLSDPGDKVDGRLADDLVQVYEQRTRGVYRVPYDPVLVSGSVVPYDQLSAATTRSWLRACAAMSEAL